MRAARGDSRFLLIDLQSSLYSACQIPLSTTLTYLSSTFRRTRGVQHKRIASSPSPASPLLRRPSDRSRAENGPVSEKSSSASLPCISGSSELGVFLELLPERMRSELGGHPEVGELIEVVMDLGREPLARFPSGDWVIAETPVTLEDLMHAVSKVGGFSDDNRSGINSSLHRISAIRNRKLQIIGLTCRVGRAISGSAEIIRDLVESGESILVIGCPGVGKTTLIREIARMLADDQGKRVVIVDTSNEIGGDGDIPHSGIGRARRMQVPNVNMQHNVMIEAVENHMPQTIIIDEIGTELEALAACTIAQRGVQLVGTAHGMTIENIVKNPSLQILIGGIESVTLGDEEARKRKVQKTILERKGPAAFTCAVELISKTEYRVHHRLDATVDALLEGKTPRHEIRQVEAEDANFTLELAHSPLEVKVDKPLLVTLDQEKGNEAESEKGAEYHQDQLRTKKVNRSLRKRTGPFFVYTYKILEADLLQVVNVMGLEDKIDVVGDIGAANAILASISELKQNPWIRTLAKFHQVPIYVIKSNTMAQMVKAIDMIVGKKSFGHASKHPFKSSVDMEIEEFLQKDIEIEDDAPERKPTLEEIDALEEVRLAIEYIVIPGGEPVELLPRRSDIIARQLKLVESYQLAVENSGTDHHPRLQILPQRKYSKPPSSKTSKPSSNVQKEIALETLTDNFGATTVSRLPLLPE